jgi:large subunit ribosomal protein L6
MSRVGRKPVPVPNGVQVAQKGDSVVVTGPKGSIETKLPDGVELTMGDGEVSVSRPARNRVNRGFQGLARALVANMVRGVTQGYERSLDINGVGYKAELTGEELVLVLGYSHPVHIDVPKGVKVEVSKPGTNIKVSGIDRQVVGQLAAQIRAAKIPEPYKAKGVKYSDETLRRKVGKAGAK